MEVAFLRLKYKLQLEREELYRQTGNVNLISSNIIWKKIKKQKLVIS